MADTKKELSQCQRDLDKARSGVTQSKTANKSTANRKRALQSTEPVAVLTPEVDRTGPQRPSKKRGIEQSILGEKSAFSVTPFLNRSRDDSSGLQPGLSAADDEDEPAEEVAADEDPPEPRSDDSADEEPNLEDHEEADVVPKTLLQKARGRPKTSPAATAPKRGQNTRPAAAAAAKPTALTSKKKAKAKEVQDDEPESRETQKQALAPPTILDTNVLAAPGEKEGKKRKRKVLGGGDGRGGTIFDGDEDDEPIPKAKATGFGRKRALLGGMPTALGGFSPLKRDRRGVGASFLA